MEKASEASNVNIDHLEMAYDVSIAVEAFLTAAHELIEDITGFSANYFKVLRMLYIYSPEGVAISKVAEHVKITRPSMTQIINNLEKRSLIGRVENPTDKRSSLISLTPKGVEDVGVIFAKYNSAIAELSGKAGAKQMQNSAAVIAGISQRLNNRKE